MFQLRMQLGAFSPLFQEALPSLICPAMQLSLPEALLLYSLVLNMLPFRQSIVPSWHHLQLCYIMNAGHS